MEQRGNGLGSSQSDRVSTSRGIPQPRLKTSKSGFPIATADVLGRATDRASSAFRRCKRKVEMSGSRKVEMSKLPFRQLAEAEIGISDDEWKRVAAH
jgi:hypothetical protein